MADPNWNNGFYYDGLPPHTGMKLARREYTPYLFVPAYLKVSQKLRLSPTVRDRNGISASAASFVPLQN